jgi:integrase
MEFTANAIADLELPAGKSDHFEWDDAMPGFGIRLRAGGKRGWMVQYRVHGRQRRQSIGDARRIDLKAARDAARKTFAEVALGGDPQGNKTDAQARAAVTIGPLFDQYLEIKKPKVRRSTYVADHRYLTNYWKPARRLPIDAVNRRMVASRLNDIVKEHGSTAAARARQSLSAFFSWAIGEGHVDRNPVVGTNDPAAHIQSRDRVLTEAELRAIWQACADDDFGRIIRLLMFTGARRDEIGGLRWSEVDLDRALLNIPGTRTKNHHPLKLTLPPPAVSILRAVARRPGRDLIFGGGRGPFGAWSYETLALRARITETLGGSIPEWRIHDIRRTVATGMGALGVQPHIIEAVLNHRSGHKAGVAGIYNRATYETEIKLALELWARHLQSLLGVGSANVVQLTPAA